jgi:hypothetical protein
MNFIRRVRKLFDTDNKKKDSTNDGDFADGGKIIT